MSSKGEIRAIVAEQLVGLRALSKAGALSQDELTRLETLAKIAVTADRVEAGDVEPPVGDSAALEAALHGG